MQIDLDVRLLTLAAALTAGSDAPASGAKPEHSLVADTRNRLAPYAGHPAVTWLRAQLAEAGLLGLAMQTVQLGAPPAFAVPSPADVPAFVQENFNWVPLSDLAGHLRTFWCDANVGGLLADQRPLWDAVVGDLAPAITPCGIAGFQRRFWGRAPYHIKLVPLASMAPCGVSGVGAASLTDSYAICLPDGDRPYNADLTRLLTLAQHEASHPILDDIQHLHPGVDAACTFIEEAAPPSGRFALFYGDPVFRWVETVIRTSGYFFLEEVVGHDAAEAYRRQERAAGVTMIDPTIDALAPWWAERCAGRAPGLDQALPQLPAWLRHRIVC